MELEGTIENGVVVLDVPGELPSGTRVKVTASSKPESSAAVPKKTYRQAVMGILARTGGIPPDFEVPRPKSANPKSLPETIRDIVAEARALDPDLATDATAALPTPSQDRVTEIGSSEHDVADQPLTIWDKLRQLAERAEQLPCEMPEDFAAQHDHYLYGTPKRP